MPLSDSDRSTRGRRTTAFLNQRSPSRRASWQQRNRPLGRRWRLFATKGVATRRTNLTVPMACERQSSYPREGAVIRILAQPRQQVWLLTAGLSSRLAANSVVEVNDAVSEPALGQEREQDADVLGQCAPAATNNDPARGTGVTRRPDPRRSLAASSAPPIVMSAPAEWDGPYGRGDASRQATEAIQPGRSVWASGLNAPRPVGPGLRCGWLIVVDSS